MSVFLIHMHTGPTDPTRAALGFLVAAVALTEGHTVNLFLAGDAVHLLNGQHVETLEGQGTGKISDHIRTIEANGGRFFLSGMSAKARGYDDRILKGHPAEFAMPDVLVRLADEADKVLCY